MRISIAFIVSLLVTQVVEAQLVSDVNQFLSNGLNGSSRFTSMGGAFGALGGDLTAVSYNPASSSVFLHSEFGTSLTFTNNLTEGRYFGSSETEENSILKWDQFGAVFVFNNSDPKSQWKKISAGINTHKIVNFDQKATIFGNNSKGIDSYFLYYADGLAFENLPLYDQETVDQVYRILGDEIGFGAQQAFLGYQSYIINPTQFEDGNTSYYSNVEYNQVSHRLDLINSGFHRKTSFNFSALYGENLHLGFNINNHKLEYSNEHRLSERDHSMSSNTYNIDFNNSLKSFGEGFSAQFGVILKLKKIRLGATYDSPQWLTIMDETEQSVRATHYDYENGSIVNEQISPNVTNVYDQYEFKIPAIKTLSFAYIFGTKGVLSMDYSNQNVANTKLSQENGSDYLKGLNSDINTTFDAINTLRVGGEYRLKDISLRAGFVNRNNTLKNNLSNDQAITLGLGLDFGSSSLNLSFVQFNQNKEFKLYSEGLTDSFKLSNNATQVSISYNLKL